MLCGFIYRFFAKSKNNLKYDAYIIPPQKMLFPFNGHDSYDELKYSYDAFI